MWKVPIYGFIIIFIDQVLYTSSELSFTYWLPLDEIQIDSSAGKKRKFDSFREQGRERKEGGRKRDRRKPDYYELLLGNIDMAAVMEDVDCESRSQNRLQGVDVEAPAHEKEGTMHGDPAETRNVKGST